MIRRPPRSTRVRSSAASDVYKRQRPCLPCRWENSFRLALRTSQRHQVTSLVSKWSAATSIRRDTRLNAHHCAPRRELIFLAAQHVLKEELQLAGDLADSSGSHLIPIDFSHRCDLEGSTAQE